MRILLAEDERDLNQIIRQKLTSDGYMAVSYTHLRAHETSV